jgi:hypothetical protein
MNGVSELGQRPLSDPSSWIPATCTNHTMIHITAWKALALHLVVALPDIMWLTAGGVQLVGHLGWREAVRAAAPREASEPFVQAQYYGRAGGQPSGGGGVHDGASHGGPACGEEPGAQGDHCVRRGEGGDFGEQPPVR